MTSLTHNLPPQAIDLEKAVLGAMLTDREALVIGLTEISNCEIFYVEAHQLIFEACKSLFAISSPIDILTVTNELRSQNKLKIVGGASKVSEIGTDNDNWNNVSAHVAILKQKWIRRLVLKVSGNNIKHAQDESFDEFELIEKASMELLKLNEQLSIKKIEGGKSVYLKAMQQIAQAMQSPGATGLQSGIEEIDKVTGGWQSPDLVIIAGRPGMGKTAFVISATKNIFLYQNKKVLMFSLEMTSTQIYHRLISCMGDISGAKIKKGYLSDSEYLELQNKTQSLYTDNFLIDDTASITIGQLRAKAISEKMKDSNLSLIIVDYLQLMGGTKGGNNREREISEISAGLKALAKELNLPILALAQLSRAVESRTVKKPQLSDLRESGSIEQDADVVIFLNRPEYYDIKEYENGDSTKDTAEALIAKNRHGGPAEVIIGCDLSRFNFHSMALPTFNTKITVENNFDNPFV